MRKSSAFLILILSSILLFSAQRDSFIKIDKLKSLIAKEERSEKISPEKKVNNIVGSFIPSSKIIPTPQIPELKKKDDSSLKTEDEAKVLGVIISKNGRYRAALIKVGENFVFLREGERDEFFNIKLLKVLSKKIIVYLKKEKKEIEVEDE